MSESSTPEATPEAPEVPKQETFSRDYVESLRNEAAKYRNEKKDAVDAAKAEVIRDYEAKLAEKDTALAGLQTEHSAAALELLKLKKVLEAEIPSADALEVAALVQGTDEESVSESVKRVKALLGKAPAKVPAVDVTQGSGGKDIPLNGDPVLDLLKRAVGA